MKRYHLSIEQGLVPTYVQMKTKHELEVMLIAINVNQNLKEK